MFQHSQYSDADDVRSGVGLSGKLFWLPPVGGGVLVAEGGVDVVDIGESPPRSTLDAREGEGLGSGPVCRHGAEMRNEAFFVRAYLGAATKSGRPWTWRRAASLSYPDGVHATPVPLIEPQQDNPSMSGRCGREVSDLSRG